MPMDGAVVNIDIYIIEYSRHTFQEVLGIAPGLEADDVIAKQASVDSLGYCGWQAGLPVTNFGPGNVNELLHDNGWLGAVGADHGGNQVEMVVVKHNNSRGVLITVKFSANCVGNGLICLTVAVFPRILDLFSRQRRFNMVEEIVL